MPFANYDAARSPHFFTQLRDLCFVQTALADAENFQLTSQVSIEPLHPCCHDEYLSRIRSRLKWFWAIGISPNCSNCYATCRVIAPLCHREIKLPDLDNSLHPRLCFAAFSMSEDLFGIVILRFRSDRQTRSSLNNHANNADVYRNSQLREEKILRIREYNNSSFVKINVRTFTNRDKCTYVYESLNNDTSSLVTLEKNAEVVRESPRLKMINLRTLEKFLQLSLPLSHRNNIKSQMCIHWPKGRKWKKYRNADPLIFYVEYH